MNQQVSLGRPGGRLYLRIRKETFHVDGTCLILEDEIPLASPWMGERILWIAGTGAYYSVLPLSPFRHHLLCFTFCEDAYRLRAPAFYHHALVLGCGGGAVPRFLLETSSSLTVDVVDRSPKIIEMCKKYGLHRWNRSSRLTYDCEDAADFTPPSRTYQFIFCDLFGGETLAPVVYDPDFARKLGESVSEDGILVINCGWHHLLEVQMAYRPVFQHLKIVERDPWQTEVLMASNRPFDNE